jgi:hypothetical protein
MVMVSDRLTRAREYITSSIAEVRSHFWEDIWITYIIIAWVMVIMFSGKFAAYYFGLNN